jgi:hypothetical protein
MSTSATGVRTIAAIIFVCTGRAQIYSLGHNSTALLDPSTIASLSSVSEPKRAVCVGIIRSQGELLQGSWCPLIMTVRMPSRAAALRAAKRKPHYYAHIDKTPYAYCFGLAFLMMFLEVSAYPSHRQWPPLPIVQNSRLETGASRDGALLVSVFRDGRFYFHSSGISAEELPGATRASLRRGSENKVYIVADQNPTRPDTTSRSNSDSHFNYGSLKRDASHNGPALTVPSGLRTRTTIQP